MKPTGSIYLHCDPTAGHYLKLLMDAIFGHGNFRNEVVWKRTAGRSDGKRFGRVHDTILFYAGHGATWNRQHTAHDPDYVARSYRNEDERGRWQSADLTASGPRFGESGEPWQGIDPGKVGRHWNTPTQGGMNYFIIGKGLIPDWPDHYLTVQSRLDALDAAGLIAWPKHGDGMLRLKRYLESTTGIAVEDVFTDIGKLEASAKEKIGYPTQKPLALLERLIKASSNEGDVVLDPFCGCATACVAADRLGRRVGGDRHIPQGRGTGEHAASTGYGQPVPPRIRHRPDGYPPADGHRGSNPLPPEQARPLRPAGRVMRRLPGRLPLQVIRGRPYGPTVPGRHGPHGKLATAVFKLQSHQGRSAPGVSDGPPSGDGGVIRWPFKAVAEPAGRFTPASSLFVGFTIGA